MRAPEVVGLDEESDPPLAIVEIREDRPREKFLPQRLPEALDLAQRLRVVRPALDVPDALPAQLLLEIGVPAPRHVLPSLVGQDLARRAVLRDPARQRLQHQRRALVMRHHQRHQEARVVVHEGRHVQAVVTAQQKREDVRLPELVRLRPLEAVLGRTRLGHRLRYCLQQPLFVEDPPHRRLRHAQALEARHHVPDPARALLGMRPPRLHHRFAPRVRPCVCRCLLLAAPPRSLPPPSSRPTRNVRYRCAQSTTVVTGIPKACATVVAGVPRSTTACAICRRTSGGHFRCLDVFAGPAGCLVLGFIPSSLSLRSVREKEGRLLRGFADTQQCINRCAHKLKPAR